jgi:hypothetical protein
MTAKLQAARSARRWLAALELVRDDQRAARDLGIALADLVIDGVPPPDPPPETARTSLPASSELVSTDRNALLELSRTYSGGIANRFDEDLAVAQLAASFARTDDLQAVAALLRLAAQTGAEEELLEDTWRYIYGQQHPDGYFGLLSAELVLLGRERDVTTPRLAMTVEVLWALATPPRAARGIQPLLPARLLPI